jgi:hypothetical protein
MVLVAVVGAGLIVVRQYLRALPRPLMRVSRTSLNQIDAIQVTVFYDDCEEVFYDAKPFGTLNEMVIKKPGQKALHYFAREGGRPNRPGEQRITEAMENHYRRLQSCLEKERRVVLTSIAEGYYREFPTPTCLPRQTEVVIEN